MFLSRERTGGVEGLSVPLCQVQMVGVGRLTSDVCVMCVCCGRQGGFQLYILLVNLTVPRVIRTVVAARGTLSRPESGVSSSSRK